jgi:hypothetical protein
MADGEWPPQRSRQPSTVGDVDAYSGDAHIGARQSDL